MAFVNRRIGIRRPLQNMQEGRFAAALSSKAAMRGPRGTFQRKRELYVPSRISSFLKFFGRRPAFPSLARAESKPGISESRTKQIIPSLAMAGLPLLPLSILHSRVWHWLARGGRAVLSFLSFGILRWGKNPAAQLPASGEALVREQGDVDDPQKPRPSIWTPPLVQPQNYAELVAALNMQDIPAGSYIRGDQWLVNRGWGDQYIEQSVDVGRFAIARCAVSVGEYDWHAYLYPVTYSLFCNFKSGSKIRRIILASAAEKGEWSEDNQKQFWDAGLPLLGCIAQSYANKNADSFLAEMLVLQDLVKQNPSLLATFEKMLIQDSALKERFKRVGMSFEVKQVIAEGWKSRSAARFTKDPKQPAVMISGDELRVYAHHLWLFLSSH
ncbi:MAG TPA: hypothetical protein DF383_01800, partial [Deltaproteobacteria bacterium]|nr:hypothetical protein [Deltaproteobacteria bacterium]